jgi:hypothetical protein
MNKEEHYKNNPNDKEPTPEEKKLSSKYNKLKHKFKVWGIQRVIAIRILKTQIKADNRIKKMFEEMYPEEYKKVLEASINKYGVTKKRPERREEIIQSMNLKDRNILGNKYK